MKLFFAGLLLSQCVVMFPAVANAQTGALDTRKINAVKIEVSDPQLARKIAISYHHAILETNFAAGYLVADLTPAEVKRLAQENVKLVQATDWLQQFEKISGKTLDIAQQKSSTNVLDGIEGYSCYPTVEETYQAAADLATDNPQLAEWVDIGDSWNKVNGFNGYDLKVLQITNKTIGGDKPILFIQSAMHAREYTTAALTLDFAKMLLENYQNDADIRWILDYHRVDILFHTNPDGRKIAESQIFQRKNTNQNHCPQDSVGVDLNRNFAFFWNVAVDGSSSYECDETYRGQSAESEPETQAVSSYIRSLYADKRGTSDDDAAPEDTSGMHLDIHSYSQLVLWPYGHKEGISPNNASFVELGNKLAWYNHYTPQQSIGLYPTDGTSDSVSYGELGVAALAFEIGTQFFESCSNYTSQIKPDNLKALLYAAKVVAAPYKLPFGPEIGQIQLNGATSSISISQGTPVHIEATANAQQTRLSSSARRIGKVEYSLDVPVWSATATAVELVENDGALDSSVEVLNGQIDTSGWGEGEHILYTRAYNQNNQPGVTSAVFVSVGTNNSPVPDITYQCQELVCDFDASASTDIDGTVTAFSWDFNSEASASSAQTTHVFAFAGEKRVSLTIIDNSGNSVEKTISIDVIAATPDPVPLPQPQSQSHSGGGSIGWLFWCLGLSGIWGRLKSLGEKR